MAIRFLVFFQVFIIYSTSLLRILPQNSCNASNTPKLAQCGFNAIYNLGTSISDTGNSAVDNPSTWQAKFPYGETIHEATGRPSDGLLIIDYIAKSADLPLVVPYKNLSAAHLSACHGVNFAYSGATALSKEALPKKNITLELTNPSLDVQLGWLDDYFDGFCHNVKEDCTKALSSSLFMMNFGTNDYGSAFRQNHSMEEIKKNNLVSDVVEAMKQALKKIINRGARKVLAFGVALDGCRPISLAMQSANKSATYDRFGCVKDNNDFCKYHNEVLQEGLKELREQHPDVQIVYGDLYNAMQSVFDNFKSPGLCFGQAREQLLQLIMSSSTTAMHAAMSSLNFVLLALLQLKYQNKEISPFEAHGTIMLLYILASIIYSTALIALLLRAHHQLPETPCLAALEHISLLSGALACGLLLLILAPPFGYFLLAICGVLVLVKALLGSYQQIVGQLLDVAAISERARDLILKVFHRSGRQEARDQAHAMASQSMNRVLTDHNSTDQGSGDHNTTPIGSV